METDLLDAIPDAPLSASSVWQPSAQIVQHDSWSSPLDSYGISSDEHPLDGRPGIELYAGPGELGETTLDIDTAAIEDDERGTHTLALEAFQIG